MTTQDSDRDQTLERNVDRLIALHAASATIPEVDRERVLDALLEERGSEGALMGRVGPAVRRNHRWAIPALATAAAVVVAVIVFWPGRGSDGVAWSQVAKRLAGVRALSFWTTGFTVPSSSNSAERKVFPVFRVQTENASRTEWYTSKADSGAVDHVSIIRYEPNRVVTIWLVPGERTASRTYEEGRGTLDDAVTSEPQHPSPDQILKQFQQLAKNPGRSLGMRTIDGRTALGFESIIEQPRPLNPITLQVWLDVETEVLVQVVAEVEGQRTLMTDIAIDPPLAPDTFDVPREPGWKVSDSWHREFRSGEKRLKPRVELRVSIKGEPPVISEGDIAHVQRGDQYDSGDPEDLTNVHFDFKLRPEARERWKAFIRDHKGSRLHIEFDGKVIAGPILMGYVPEDFSLYIAPLGLSAEEFEARYLVPQEE